MDTLCCQAPPPPLNLQTVPTPLFKQPPPPPLKVGFLSECPKYQSFSSLTPFYLLKVMKFLVNICQFEFLVMIEKNVFVYKLFLSLNISDLFIFFCKIATRWKELPPLFQQPPSQSWGPVQPPFLKIWWEVQSPQQKGSVHTIVMFTLI